MNRISSCVKVFNSHRPSMRHLRMSLILSMVFMAAVILGAPVMGAASPPPSIESTITVVGRGNAQFVLHTDTTRAAVISSLQAHYGGANTAAGTFTLVIGGQHLRLTPAEVRSIVPAQINLNAKADTILVASRNRAATVNINGTLAPQLNQQAIGVIADRYIAQTRVAPAAARYVYNSRTRRIDVRTSRQGSMAPRAQVIQSIQNSLMAFAAQGYRGNIATVNTARSVPIISDTATRRQLGKIILIVRSERRLFLYNRGQIEAQYRVAIGRKANPTPRGDFVIGAKRRNPTWTNPGSKWARNMPRTIGPGPKNPLGVRAMNLNRTNGRTTLLRIHGTSNTRSIGQAASSGCIRLTNPNIIRLFNATPSGTRVWIR